MVKVLVVDNGSSSCDALVQSLTELGSEDARTRHEDVESIGGYGGIVLSGRAKPSRESNVNNFKIIREAHLRRKPLLGICYGMEILATAFGGTLSRLPGGRKEARTIVVTKKNRLIQEESFIAAEAHAFRIARLPADLERLARSETSEYEAIVHSDAELYGVQFHPELSGESGIRILKNFIDMCD